MSDGDAETRQTLWLKITKEGQMPSLETAAFGKVTS
jgi:hypothetical protein